MEKIPYKLKDQEGNIFVFAYYENGYPVYRTSGGSKHIFESDIKFYKTIQKKHPTN